MVSSNYSYLITVIMCLYCYDIKYTYSTDLPGERLNRAIFVLENDCFAIK